MSTNHSSPVTADTFEGLGWREYMRGIENGNIDPTGERLRAICRLAREALEGAAPAQCAPPEELAREELAIARLRAAITGEEFEWGIDGGSPFDDVQFLLRAYDRLAPSTVTSTVQQPVENKVWPTGTGNTPQDVQLASLVTRPERSPPVTDTAHE